ncbi:hypothetical protein N431DRAFT_557803 [Stipitochalara longipes BDJ]|nr:hypothetical protein N431DRAFT_557803 [Stipitochalara longipes BDJ]
MPSPTSADAPRGQTFPQTSVPTRQGHERLKIIVGPPGSCVEFFAIKPSMCAHSVFFKVACHPQWESGRTQIINLSADDPKIFALFLAWVQTGCIESSEYFTQLALNGTDRSVNIRTQWDQLCSCFVYGDFLQANTFQNRVLDLLVTNIRMQQRHSSTMPRPKEESILYIYEHTTRGSPLRKLILDTIITSPTHEIPNHDFSNPHLLEYLVDLATYAIDQAKSSRLEGKPCTLKVPWKNDPCSYHHHPGHAAGFYCTGTAIRPWEIE